MKEQRLINIFVFGNETHVHTIGWRLYEKAGTNDELKAFLQSNVHDDHQIAARKDLEEPIPWRNFEGVRLFLVGGPERPMGFCERHERAT